MNFYSNVTEANMIDLTNLSKQQKKQSAIKDENRTSKQSHDEELAEIFKSRTTKKEVIESTNTLRGILERSYSENEKRVLPFLQSSSVFVSQSLSDTLKRFKKRRNFGKLVEKPNHIVFWNRLFNEPIK